MLKENEEAKTANVKEEVMEMISYVSASVNGNSVPTRAEKDPSLLWPRFCDRLESIGVIGWYLTIFCRAEAGRSRPLLGGFSGRWSRIEN